MNRSMILLMAAFGLCLLSCGQNKQKSVALEQTTASEIAVPKADNVMEDDRAKITYVSDIIDIKEIDSSTFYTLKATANPQDKEQLTAIDDIEEARRLLNGIVVWGNTTPEGKIYESEDGELPVRINFRNGEVLSFEEDTYEYEFFIAYYPHEDILLLEGGHTTDVSYNLSTGEERKNAGNPSYIVFSPSKKYRLNGWFGGQECSFYFIQQKEEERYKKIVQLDTEFENLTGIWLCTIYDGFWTDDTTLNILTEVPINNGKNSQRLYYQILLKD